MNELNVSSIRDQAARQVTPLKHDDESTTEFFNIISEVWEIADKDTLAKEITYTNFVMFGPQSVGKTSLVERILQFPVAVVKSTIATTRPMVLITKHNAAIKTEKITVRESGGTAIPMEKKGVMKWVEKQMQGPISEKKIHITVEGEGYMNRRFVDLPGFQQNDDGSGAREKIINLLLQEREKENTVVVCVEDSKLEFVNCNLDFAIERVYGKENFKAEGDEKFVIVLNKSDEWLQSPNTTAGAVVARLSDYVKNFGLLPILVGGSIDKDNGVLRDQRNESDFDRIVDELRGAQEREAAFLTAFLEGDKGHEGCHLKDFRQFMGFESFLGIVDAMVLTRDLQNLSNFALELSAIEAEKDQMIERLTKENDILNDVERKTGELVDQLIILMKSIMDGDSHSQAIGVLGESKVREAYGMTASEEEHDFYDNHYIRECKYELFEDQLGLDSFDTTGEDDAGKWVDRVKKTMKQLDTQTQRQHIAYLQKKLLGGKLYDRAMAVWSAMAYGLLMPSTEDLDILPQLVGTNSELGPDTDRDFLQAKRLAEIYARKLTPAVQYLCQKMEFLVLKIFDTAWISLLRKNYYSRIVGALGGDSFKATVKNVFEKAIEKSARLAYNRVFFDLQNEVYKLMPYSKTSPAVTAMKFAFAEHERDIDKRQEEYRETVSAQVKKHLMIHVLSQEGGASIDALTQGNKSGLLPDGGGKALEKGLIHGIDILSMFGSINPLVFAGLQVLKGAIIVVWSELKKRREKAGAASVSEETDERALGFAVVMYTHFLPRFIASIDGRMRADLWACFHNACTSSSIRQGVLKSSDVELRQTIRDNNIKKVDCLVHEKASIAKTCKDIQIFLSTRTGTLQKSNKKQSKRHLNHSGVGSSSQSGGNGDAGTIEATIELQ
jgi:GTPase SAR1 family protein